MKSLQIPFAIHKGELIDIAYPGLPRGRACDCTCPGCGRALIARLGNKNIAHFAHATESETNGGSCGETALHMAAKAVLLHMTSLLLPPILRAPGLPGMETEKTLRAAALFDLDKVLLEQRIETKSGFIRPDAIVESAITDDSLECVAYYDYLIVEIKVSHGVDERKMAQLRELGIKAVEITLDRFQVLTLEQLRTALEYGATRKWLHHPDDQALVEPMKELCLALLAVKEAHQAFANAKRIYLEQEKRIIQSELDYTRDTSSLNNAARPLEGYFRRGLDNS